MAACNSLVVFLFLLVVNWSLPNNAHARLGFGGGRGFLHDEDVQTFGPWGSQNPQEAKDWSFIVAENEILKEIIIGYGDIIDAIGFTVTDGSGLTTTTKFGNPGAKVAQISFSDDEYILKISGTHGEYKWNNYRRTISSLKIHTNKNPNGYGPYGLVDRDTQNVVSFASPPLGPGDIVTFFGKLGNAKQYLEALGITAKVPDSEEFGPWGSEDFQDTTKWKLEFGEEENIKEILIRHADIVDSIGFTIANGNGQTTTQVFGNVNSNLDKITLGENEYIVKISGTYGNYKWNYDRSTISSLKIYTNLNDGGYGPYGLVDRDTTNVASFSSPLLGPGDVMGFYGTIGSTKHYLESIGLIGKDRSESVNTMK